MSGMNAWSCRSLTLEDDSLSNLGCIDIVRIIPGDASVSIEWSDKDINEINDKAYYKVAYKKRGDTGIKETVCGNDPVGRVEIDRLHNGVDYEVYVSAEDPATGRILGKSHARLFRTGTVPGVIINYVHPNDPSYRLAGHFIGSPSIVKLGDGRLVASHDLFAIGADQNLSKIYRSEDGGASWEYLTDLYPCFWGKLFIHKEALYMLSMSTEYGELLIGRSDDGGETWTAPRSILPGKSCGEGAPHKGPMPVVPYKGRLWTVIDYLWENKGYVHGIASVPEDSDISEPKNWTVSPFPLYNPGGPGSVLEGNVVVSPDGGLVIVPRYIPAANLPDYGLTALFRIDSGNPSAYPAFIRTVKFHGNSSKFTVQQDKKSQKYWALVNRVTLNDIKQRNIVTLVCSDDLEKWDLVRDVINLQDNGWPEDHTEAAFQYLDWIIDENDILAVSRTAINGADSFHNANHLTFHRIEDFRNMV